MTNPLMAALQPGQLNALPVQAAVDPQLPNQPALLGLLNRRRGGLQGLGNNAPPMETLPPG